MRQIFETCEEAISCSLQQKSFGIFYSEKLTSNLKVHLHDCCELFFCMSDGHSFIIDKKIYEVKKGDVFVINPFESHKVYSGEPSLYGEGTFKRYSVHIDPTFLYANSDNTCNLAKVFFSAKPSNRLSLSEAQQEEFLHLLQKIDTNYDCYDSFYKKIYMIEILLKINHLFLPPRFYPRFLRFVFGTNSEYTRLYRHAL